MPRWTAAALLAASATVLGGCCAGWRLGAGASANTEGSVAGQLFGGFEIGAAFTDRSVLQFGAETDASLRSNPARMGAGLTERGDFRVEPEDKGVGWMFGGYAGVRGLFLDGNLVELRTGASFDILPTISVTGHTYKHVGVEIQGGVATLSVDPEHEKPPDRGEFTLRVFYDVFSVEKH